MNTELLEIEIRQIEARHSCPKAACAEIFRFIQLAIRENGGQPVTAEFKRALRRALDQAYERGCANDEPGAV